ncbi:MAG TPA: sugar ABC transporter ATP-binding protein, partial [Fimbriimonas sp.]
MNDAVAHIELRNAKKRYGHVTVLDCDSFDVLPGEVHVLAGENGAGKSTLIKILGGAITEYEGELRLGGEAVAWKSPHDASARGVAVIHQELSLVPSMSVVDNLYLGDLPVRRGFVRQGAMRRQAREALRKVGLQLPLDELVERLPIATQQLVEVAKALRREARVVVMDEPTSALNVREAERLFALIQELKSQGCGVVYITHKMDEIERLADRITVLRDGKRVATEAGSEVGADRLIRLMVGDKGLRPTEAAPRTPPGETVLAVEGLTVHRHGREVARDVSLSVRKGEVVGLAGLEGSGNSAV